MPGVTIEGAGVRLAAAEQALAEALPAQYRDRRLSAFFFTDARRAERFIEINELADGQGASAVPVTLSASLGQVSPAKAAGAAASASAAVRMRMRDMMEPRSL